MKYRIGVGIVWRLKERRRGGARPDIVVNSVSWRGCEGGHRAGIYGSLWDWRGVVWPDTFD